MMQEAMAEAMGEAKADEEMASGDEEGTPVEP